MLALTLETLPGHYAIARLDGAESIPEWAQHAPHRGAFICIARSREELSIAAPQDLVPSEIRAERNLRAWRVVGPLPFEAIGILARLAQPLADAGVPLLAIATYDTDYLFVQGDRSALALAAWRGAGIALR